MNINSKQCHWATHSPGCSFDGKGPVMPMIKQSPRRKAQILLELEELENDHPIDEEKERFHSYIIKIAFETT